MKKPFQVKVDSPYGAPMGRHSDDPSAIAGLANLEYVLLEVGYDEGGAYWGNGEPLYCAWSVDGEKIAYVRAPNMQEAGKAFPNALFNWHETFVSEFLAAYMDVILRRSTDTKGIPLDCTYSVFDFTPEAKAKAEADCREFIGYASWDIWQCPEDAARAFWFTRNAYEHGGFWAKKWFWNAQDELLTIAEGFDSVTISVSGGKIHYH